MEPASFSRFVARTLSSTSTTRLASGTSMERIARIFITMFEPRALEIFHTPTSAMTVIASAAMAASTGGSAPRMPAQAKLAMIV